MDEPSLNRLAIYGTLAPGQVNHHIVEGIGGRWLKGRVHGRLIQAGWGAEHGCPGMHLDPQGEVIDVNVLEADNLPDHWERLDAFEGDEYARVRTQAETNEGLVEVHIYVLR